MAGLVYLKNRNIEKNHRLEHKRAHHKMIQITNHSINHICTNSNYTFIVLVSSLCYNKCNKLHLFGGPFMSKPLHRQAEKFQSRLKQLGHAHEVLQLPDSTRTAQEAAEAIGCNVEQIAKSIIFRLKNANEAILIIASGKNRVNENMVEILAGDELAKADADFVKKMTGYAIGGVPPLAHDRPIMTLIDEDLFQYDTIWAAAGHAKAVFQLTPAELETMTRAEVISIG